MLMVMRNTLVLDDELVRRAKKLAAEQNTTLGEIVNRSLRQTLLVKSPEPAPFEMVTFGATTSIVHHEPADFSAILEEEEVERARSRSVRKPSGARKARRR